MKRPILLGIGFALVGFVFAACQNHPTQPELADDNSLVLQPMLTILAEECTNGDCPPDPGCTNGDCPPDPGCTNGDCPPPDPGCTNGDCPPGSQQPWAAIDRNDNGWICWMVPAVSNGSAGTVYIDDITMPEGVRHCPVPFQLWHYDEA
jgi:hypothetical protein